MENDEIITMISFQDSWKEKRDKKTRFIAYDLAPEHGDPSVTTRRANLGLHSPFIRVRLQNDGKAAVERFDQYNPLLADAYSRGTPAKWWQMPWLLKTTPWKAWKLITAIKKSVKLSQETLTEFRAKRQYAQESTKTFEKVWKSAIKESVPLVELFTKEDLNMPKLSSYDSFIQEEIGIRKPPPTVLFKSRSEPPGLTDEIVCVQWNPKTDNIGLCIPAGGTKVSVDLESAAELLRIKPQQLERYIEATRPAFHASYDRYQNLAGRDAKTYPLRDDKREVISARIREKSKKLDVKKKSIDKGAYRHLIAR